jgi:rare lipoprotein A
MRVEDSPRLAVAWLAALIAGGCGTVPDVQQQDGPPPQPVDFSSIPDAVPRPEPRSPYGNPDSYVVNGRRYYVLKSSEGFVERGIASWYGRKFHGRRTSSGETYNMYAMTAAHKHLPLPTYVEVINLQNGGRVVVKVNDRGPFHDNRIIDLSYAAAGKLGILGRGTGLVEVRAVQPGRAAGAPPVSPAPAVVTVGGGSGGFYIQVGSFTNLDNAEQLRARLAELHGSTVAIRQAVVSGQTVYRVRIGPLHDVETADAIVARLAHMGLTQHHIVLD